jgi:hypothetical protein
LPVFVQIAIQTVLRNADNRPTRVEVQGIYREGNSRRQ